MLIFIITTAHGNYKDSIYRVNLNELTQDMLLHVKLMYLCNVTN